MPGNDYHYDACSITGEECDGLVCSSCDTAIRHEQNEIEEKQEALITFDNESTLCGTKQKANRACTIIRLENEEQLKTVIGLKPERFSQTRREYNESLMTIFPEFFKLKKALTLSVPNEIFADKDKLGVFKYDTAIYLVAPLIDAEQGGT